MVISPEQEALIERVFESYLTEHHRVDLLQLVADTSEETHRPVVINAMTLFEANMEVGDYFNAYPSDVLVIFDKVLLRKAEELSQTASSMHGGQQRTKYLRMRHTPHARITGLPVCPELTRDTIPRSRDVGHFLSVTGTVIRTSVAKVLEYEREYQCAKCRHVFPVQADFEQFYTFAQLVSCPNPDGCNSHKFTCLSDGSEPAACRDYQEIKIQEQVQRLSVGSIPRSVVVVLEDDLADSCKSGDDVTVYGVVCQRWKPLYDDSCCDVELVLRANNIEVNNEQAAAALVMKDIQREFEEFWISHELDPIAGRNQILLSLCPQVFGMYLIKLAVAMVLAGGVQRVDSSGTKIRGECHLLLVGDPGTGKSQFLKYAAKITPRSVLTAGIGSTTAGLTVAAVRDGGEWHLEAGALVLSDGGLCCIDEFNSIKEHDRISIHEAMEQQSISVAKAGMVCKLNTRTSILAASNPKGQYDPNEPLSVNVALASPLLSRFDLVLVLMDTRNAEWDKIISSFILDDRRREGLCADSSSLWSMDKMKAYFSVIKSFKPQVSEDANVILTRYYQLQRQSSERSTARTTIRMLESLSRLAEAHARLMYRSTVTIEDAVMAVSVMECSMQGGALLGQVNALLTSFPADPSHEYQTQCQILLEGLKLPQLLHKEMDRLARLKSHDTDASHYYQHPVREPNSNNNARRHDDDSNCKGDGLDWFHSIPQSLLSDETSTSIITATQENWNRKPNSSWSELMTANKQPKRQSEDTLSNTDVTLASVTQEEIQQSDRQRAENHPEASECVFQKVPKNTRDKRLTEGGARHGDRMGSGDVLESNQNFSCIKKRRLATTDEQKQTGTKSAAVMKKKTAPEADTRPCDGGDSRYEASEDTHRPEVSPFRETELAQRKPARRPNGRDDAKVLCERQKNIAIAGNETKGNGPTGVTPFKSGHTKSAVASSTLAKLSRFSFTCSSEPTAAAKVAQSQTGSAACPTENPKDKNTLPKRGPREKKMKSAEIMDRGEDGLTCAASELRAGLTHEQRTECTESAPSVQRSHSVPGEDDDGPAEYQHTVNLKKRRCFELDPPPSGVGASRGLFSRLGLFGSVEFSNDALDTDWD